MTPATAAMNGRAVSAGTRSFPGAASASRWNCVPSPAPITKLTVEDVKADRLLGKSETLHQAKRDCAVVHFLPQVGHGYRLKVRQVRGAPDKFPSGGARRRSRITRRQTAASPSPPTASK